MMSMYSEYVSRMDAQLKSWDTEVALLIAETDKANTRSRAAQDSLMKELRASRDCARKTFGEISFANEAATIEMRSAMEAAWASMQSALNAATPKLKRILPESASSCAAPQAE